MNEGGWKIADIRTTIDPISSGPVLPAALATARRGLTPRAGPSGRAGRAGPRRLAAAASLRSRRGSAGADPGRARCRAPGAHGAQRRRARRGSRAGRDRRRSPLGTERRAGARHSGARSGTGPVRSDLGTLALLRAALAPGTDRGEIDRLLAAVPADPERRQVQDLWHAQYLLSEGNLTASRPSSAAFRSPPPARWPICSAPASPSAA